MLSSKLNVTLLTTLLKKHGIKDIVICPGSRHISLVHNVATDPFFKCYSVIDERVAAFFAMGVALRSGKPCVVTCTQGSAILDMHTAVSEAYYQKIPLLLISTDKSKPFIEQMDGLTIDQNNLFKRMAKMEVELPLIDDDSNKEQYWYCTRLINQALAAVNRRPFGPVHINIPISDGLGAIEAQEPKVEPFEYGCFGRAMELINSKKKRLLIIGQRQNRIILEKGLAEKLEKNYIIFNEHLSNVNGLTLGSSIELVLNANNFAQFEPELVISFGGHIVADKIKTMLRQSKTVQHIQINDRDEFNDTFMHLRMLVHTDLGGQEILEKLAEASTPLDEGYKNYVFDKCKGSRDLDFEYCHMHVIKKVLHTVKEDGYIHMANSSPVRYAEFFNIPSNATYLCNRGVNGIDGSMSTAMGFAQGTKGNNYVITGDLSFFYDINGFWHDHVPSNVKIIIINNNGGEVFAPIKGFDKLDDKVKYYILTQHGTTAEHACKTYGLEYFKADKDSFESSFQAMESCNKACVLECFTDIKHDVEQLNKFIAQVNK